tara:strand:- start:529 stop:1395 length:867 start_codon:yes stop_codon:yes gene_type:complete
MGKKYMDTKAGTLESSILGVWQDAAEMKEQGHDGRTKSYKEHRAKLESARAKREEKKMDKVNQKALKKDFDDRKDKDIDNDGDVDSTDKYLHKRRKAVSKAIAKEGLEDKTDNPANSQHMCAKNVVHEEWGDGQPIYGQHADPDENGEIAWYDVMFEHGIEKGVSINELKVTREAMHNSHNKDHDKEDDGKKVLKAKKHKEVKESYEIGTDEYREYTQELTPGQEIEKYGSFKVSSMKEALAKVWGLEEKRLDKTEEDDKIAPVKGDKTMTGGKVAKVEVDPDTKKEK